MVYVKGDGTVVDRKDFSIFGWFWAVVNFIYLLYHIVTSLLFAIVNSFINSFQTLINPNYNKHGDKYVRDFRPPGSGPPKPPSRKFGGFGPSGSGPPPPPMGGGCGCG